ncbi:MAG: mobilization protein [Alphaproteobacteria bacterium]|nr:mobilization protein [Alphaproteobacteria bacterium]
MDTNNNASAKLARLADKIRLLNNKKKLLEESFKKDERKKDTRRKILLGSFVLYNLNKNEELKKIISNEFPNFLTREVDRKLFTEILQ